MTVLFLNFEKPDRLRVNGVATLHIVKYSVYAPAPNHVPPEPDWKRDPDYSDALPKHG